MSSSNNDEPMSAERLKQMQARHVNNGLAWDEQRDLLAEVERLRDALWFSGNATEVWRHEYARLRAEIAALRHTLNEIETDLAQASLESSYPVDMLPAADAQLFTRTTAARLARLHAAFPAKESDGE